MLPFPLQVDSPCFSDDWHVPGRKLIADMSLFSSVPPDLWPLIDYYSLPRSVRADDHGVSTISSEFLNGSF